VTKVGRADGNFTDEEVNKQYYYHSDHLGSAQLITNRAGEEYERMEYTPYGELWIEKAGSADQIDIPYRFSGKERDSIKILPIKEFRIRWSQKIILID
jgi:hypothetical protein